MKKALVELAEQISRAKNDKLMCWWVHVRTPRSRRGHWRCTWWRSFQRTHQISIINITFALLALQCKLWFLWYLKHKEKTSKIIILKIFEYTKNVQIRKYLYSSSESERDKSESALHVTFLLDDFSAKNFIEINREVSSQQSFRRRNAEKSGEQFGSEATFVDHESTVYPRASHVGGIFCKVHHPQPLHHSVIRPESHVPAICAISVDWTTLQAVKIKVKLSKNLKKTISY